MRWRGRIPVFAAALLATLFLACGARAEDAAGAPVKGGTLNVGFVNNTKTLDPAHSVAWSERQILFLLYDSLIDINTDFSLKPALATGWDFEKDGKRIVLHLRKDVKFQDGTPFNADAVKWNLEWRMQPDAKSPQRSQLDAIESIDVVDDMTVALNLKQPFPPLLGLLTDRAGLMVSPTAVKKYGPDFGSHPVGTGPFKLDNWVRGTSVELSRNPDFWDKNLPYLDKVVFSDISAAVVGIQRLTTDELDFVAQLTPQNTKLLEGSEDIRLVQIPVGNWFALQWHWDEPPFNNPKLRQAIAHAVNRKRINDILWSGKGSVANSETPPGLWWSPPDTEQYAYDPDLAKKLLAEGGVAPGTQLTLSAPSDNALRKLVELVKEDLEAVGLKIKLEPIAQSEWYARAVAKQINFTPMRWTQRADPDGLIQFLFDTKGAANSTGYSNPEVDKLIGEARVMTDNAKRKELYDQIHKHISDDLPYVSLAYSGEYVAMNKSVQGYVSMPDLIPRYRAMWKTAK